MVAELINEAFEEIIMRINQQHKNIQIITNKDNNSNIFVKHLLNKSCDIYLQMQIEKFDLEKKINLINKLDIFFQINNFELLIDPKQTLQNTQVTDLQQSPSVEKKAGITFKELYEIFLQEKKLDSPNIAQSTYRDYEAAYNDFIFVLPDAGKRDIAEFRLEDFRTFVDALHSHLPVNRTKLKAFKNLNYKQLKKIQLTDTQKLAPNTKQKKILAIKQIFDIAIDGKYRYLEENLAESFVLKGKAKTEAKTQREPLSDENLKKLFNSPIFTSKKELTLETAPEKYWIPLIALYTGMRQNEICQLHIEDIKSEIIDTGEEIYYFDVNDHGDKSLKNENAPRLVPIHLKLIELGFITYIEALKNKGAIRVFPNLRLHPTQKKYNTDYGKNFMTYFRRYVTKEENQVFHSLRHNASSQMLRNAVHQKLPKDLINRILGHEPDKDTTTQQYFSGYSVKELFEGVKGLEFGIF